MRIMGGTVAVRRVPFADIASITVDFEDGAHMLVVQVKPEAAPVKR